MSLPDFNILAANFGSTNATFSQADFNYSGTVTLADFNILAGRFGVMLGSPAFSGKAIGGDDGADDLRGLLDELT